MSATMPPEVDELATKIAQAHPWARVTIEAPIIRDGTYRVDARLGDRIVTASWTVSQGYEISLVVEGALDTGPDLHLKVLEEVLVHVAVYLGPATCLILDDTGTFACGKPWAHEDLSHAGVRRENGVGHGKSWIANDEEHQWRLAVPRRTT